MAAKKIKFTPKKWVALLTISVGALIIIFPQLLNDLIGIYLIIFGLSNLLS